MRSVERWATGRSAPRGVARRALGGVALVAALVSSMVSTLVAPVSAESSVAAPEGGALYLVTLDGPGLAGYRGPVPDTIHALKLRRSQDLALATVGAPAPLYRWTTALNGVAVHLSRTQAAELASLPEVATVERNAVRRLAGARGPATGLLGTAGTRGGAGTVIGVVDSGISPESPLFSAVPGLGRSPRGFRGACVAGADWPTGACNRKLVAARWFVDGFGADRVRATSSLSPRDDDGHGTQMASIAAGNAGVSVRVNDQSLGRYGGVAPQARLAVYKACWTAPDPADDGCASADLVTAIDAATSDGVDVLNLSLGGPHEFDAVELALLGAAEAGVVVVAAAGNGGDRSFAAHPGPWVTTVGGTTGVLRRGEVRLGTGTGPRLGGAMASTRGVVPARVVVAARVAAPDATRAQARVCTPGSLDASRVADTIVLCERGHLGRVDKSAAVARADGAGMVLANTGPGSVDADLHSVPTVHLDRDDSRTLRRWLARHPDARASLHPLGIDRTPPRMTAWSAGGDPAGGVLKPDVVAPAVGVLGAVPPTARRTRWDFVSGTSAATARTSGAAAVLLSRHGWSADVVRSALATTTAPVAGASALREGAGRLRPARAGSPGLAYELDVRDYRAWLDGTLRDLNTPSILLTGAQSSARRTVTNLGHRAMYFSSSATGFTRHTVVVTPAAVRLAPGESATFTVRAARATRALPLDDGTVTWLGANGTRVRIPVVISR